MTSSSAPLNFQGLQNVDFVRSGMKINFACRFLVDDHTDGFVRSVLDFAVSHKPQSLD